MSNLKLIVNTPATREGQIEDCMGEMNSLIELMKVLVGGEHLVDQRDYVTNRMELVHAALHRLLFPNG